MPTEMKMLISSEAITKRVAELATEIDACYQGEPIVVICVLKGAFLFFSDLVRALKTPVMIDFVRLASYGSGTVSSRSVSFTKDIEISIEGKDVLVVEDIIDSGRTMSFLLEQLKARNPRSLRVAVMIDKTERRETDVRSDFVGFDLPEGFIVGYGLDFDEKYRDLPSIYEFVG